MLFLSEEQVRQFAAPDEVIRAIHGAFKRDYPATVRMPLRLSMEIDGGVMLLMPCYDTVAKIVGTKTVTVTSAGVNASYELLDASTGRSQARMEANWLTDLRTAATSAVATDLLARPEAETLGIFGTGRQAFAHFGIVPRVRKFRRFLVCASGKTDATGLRRIVKQEFGHNVEQVDPETCARESDVICTCTNSPIPVLNGLVLGAGTHLNLIGAFQPHTREADDATVQRARIVVDTYEGALAEAGDLVVPLSQGVIGLETHVAGDLHEICSGKKTGRTGPDDITVFKSVGCALEDLVTAIVVFARANRHAHEQAKQALSST